MEGGVRPTLLSAETSFFTRPVLLSDRFVIPGWIRMMIGTFIFLFVMSFFFILMQIDLLVLAFDGIFPTDSGRDPFRFSALGIRQRTGVPLRTHVHLVLHRPDDPARKKSDDLGAHREINPCR